MRFSVVLAALTLAGCGSTAGTRTDVKAVKSTHSLGATPQRTSVATALEFLLTSAAADFHAHPPAEAVRFHHVHIGHEMTSGGDEQCMLCGEFSSAKSTGNSERTPFATIKTSGYAQWIGSQATGLCQRNSLVWDSNKDLSPLFAEPP